MSRNPNYTVIKASGDEVSFEVDKLLNSLKRAGADDVLAEEIASKIVDEMHDHMTTKEIYKKAFRYLKKEQHGMAARYSLKRAIMELGPAGYPFEKFIGKLLEFKDFQAQTNLILDGKCVSHEVDVRAISDKELIYIECKYHKDQGRKSDIKTALYFQSRFIDLATGDGRKYANKEKSGWLVTNTRFSSDAMRYGNCMKLTLISWAYPKGHALKELVEKSGLHPITCLTTLTRDEKRQLIEEDILLCRELLNVTPLLRKYIENANRVEKIIREAEEICQH
jgi:hypothetical protein